jgi:hypothetical protein
MTTSGPGPSNPIWTEMEIEITPQPDGSVSSLLPAVGGEGGRRPDEGPAAEDSLFCGINPSPRPSPLAGEREVNADYGFRMVLFRG